MTLNVYFSKKFETSLDTGSLGQTHAYTAPDDKGSVANEFL